MNNFALSLLLVMVSIMAFCCCCVDGKKNPVGQKAPGDAAVAPSKRAAGSQGIDFLTGAAFSAHASEFFNTTYDTRIPYDEVDLSTPEGLFDVNTNSFSPGVGNAGVWKFSASVEGVGGDRNIGLYIYRNNTEIKRSFVAGPPDAHSVVADAVAYIAENEVVYATLCCPGSFAGGISTTFSGFLISRDLPEPPPAPRRSRATMP